MHLLCSSLNLPKTCQGYGTASTSSLGISLIRSKRPHAVGPFPQKKGAKKSETFDLLNQIFQRDLNSIEFI